MPSNSHPPIDRASFYERTACISCSSTDLIELDRGRFDQDPHRSAILASAWGEAPLPYLAECEWQLVRCSNCAQVFHKRVLTPEWDQIRFERWMTKEAIEQFENENDVNTPAAVFGRAQREVGWVLALEKMTRPLRRNEAARWLDFGCGWGRTVEFASLFGFEAFGIDRSGARREQASGVGRVFESVEEFSVEQSQPVHAISLFQVLEHLHAPLECLRTLRKLLVPGGFLVLEVPDGTGFQGITNEKTLVIADGLDHVNAFDPDTLAGIAQHAGFERVRRVATAQVTADAARVIKREVNRLTQGFRRKNTHQVFRRT